MAGSAETFTVTGLSASTTYYFAIKTSDEVPNESALSNVPSAATSDGTAPAAVADLATGTVTTSSVDLSWTAPGDDAATGTATTYDVRYSTSTITAGNWASATQATGEPAPSVAGSAETFTVTGLSASTTYYFAIKTSDEVPNESAISNVPSAATSASDATAPDAIADLATGTVTTSSVQLSWTASGDDGATGTATTYDVRYSTSTITAGNWASATQATGEPAPQVAGSAETFTVTGLSESTTYFFAIKTSDEVPNESAIANVPSAATSDATAPDAVTDLATGTVTASSVQLSWTASGDDGSTGTASTYDVRYSTSTITAGNWASATQATGEPAPSVAGSAETFTVTGLSLSNIYYFAIKTSDEVPNESAISNVPSAAWNVLALEFEAETLEAQLGEPVYLSFSVENQSEVTVSDVAVSIAIPNGLAWSESLEVVDSVQTQPGQVTLYLGSLAPGGTLEGHVAFALVSALPGNMIISATAFGHVPAAAPPQGAPPTGLDVRSAEALIFVGVRAGTPLETRTVIGKIWIDEDGNGRQDNGEQGVLGVSVWNESGDVASSDSEGKLSFRNVRPGSHTFRVDRSTLPLALRVNPDGDDGFASLHLNGWASGRISFGLIPLGAKLVNFQVWIEDEAGGVELPVVTQADLAAPDDVVRSELVLEPQRAGWPDVAYPVPEGWVPLAGAARLGDEPVADPAIRLDRDGSPWMFWTLEGLREPVSVTLEPLGAARYEELVTLPPLRSDEERALGAREGITNGPGVELIAPIDGAVLGSDRLYVGALGEPGAPATLFLGDSILAEGVIRGDRQVDFIGVGLQRGTSRLRIRMENSWGIERWDSLRVHVTSVPASFAPQADTISLPADGLTIRETRVRVLDAWGVPVVDRPFVTVATGQAEVVDADEDGSSRGRQLLPGSDGWLTIRVRAASEVSVDVLTLQAGDASGEVALQHVAKARELMITSIGQLGLGAAPDDFGTVTVRGRLGAETAVTVAYDSRTLDAGRDAYGRSISPLDDAQYPILGDASVRRSEASSKPGLSARIERGTDWVATGELANMGFGTNLTLAQYRRALDGVAANVSTGPVTWSGFGALTSQSLRQVQIRGAGVSGPYSVGMGIVPGTEHVSVETRDLDNPERSLEIQLLGRLADYQIDYVTGTLLLKSPVPSTDLNNNPVFIVVTFESDGGGESTSVWGLRAATDFGFGLSVVQDRAEGESFEMLGVDMRVQTRNGSELAAEVAYAENPDTAGLAVLTSGRANLLGGAISLTGQWMHVADGFSNPSNVGLLAVDEIQAGVEMRVAGNELRVGHGRQRFNTSGIERRTTKAEVVASPGMDVSLTAGFTDQAVANGGTLGGVSRAGRLELAWQPSSRVRLWTEAQNSFLQQGSGLGDFIGGGASLAVFKQLSLEGRHLLTKNELTGDHSITRIGLKSNLDYGTRAWGSYEIAGGVDRQTNAAVVGLNQRVNLGQSWAISGSMERRQGIERAAVSDPLRAAPYTQLEEDYWSAGLSAEFLPQDGPYSASAQLERRTGMVRSSDMANVAAAVTFNRSLSMLSRGTYNRIEDAATGLPTQSSVSGLFGLALRPSGSDAFNALLKVEWKQDENRPQLNVFGMQGSESRLIGAAEAIWSPLAGVELGSRYAVRSTRVVTGTAPPLTSHAHYLGSRLDLGFASWLGVGGEGRLLLEGTSGEMRWDVAPVLTFAPIKAFEVSSGYRFGDLLDPDFASNGGQGWFLTFQARITEDVLNPADFWRNRMRSTMARRGGAR